MREGKTIGVVQDFSETVVVLDTGAETADEELDEAELLHLVLHEYRRALSGGCVQEPEPDLPRRTVPRRPKR
ncbi:hypothetical protein ACFQ6B_35745 [Streptomyces wedmorensis]|uniref:Uncharacterized protein n=1 Tax=Streptomyces wedmorensis TaxID=43759 RepID=A0ABW6J128_STRWE